MLRIALAAALIAACGGGENNPTPVTAPTEAAPSVMSQAAREFVGLALEWDVHDKGYVDAYFGPPEWKIASQKAKRSPAELEQAAQALERRLETAPASPRRRHLRTMLSSLQARMRVVGGAKLSFDEEAKLIYDTVPPHHDDAHFERVVAKIDALLAGEGALSERVETFRKAYEIPRDKLDVVMERAIAECRARTAKYIEMPKGESFTVEYVSDKPWTGYNWYQGNARSLIQVNTDLPIHIDRAIDLACHEGYPGHHVLGTLREKVLYRKNGWAEFSVFPLYGPSGPLAEGSANYGIELAFPGAGRVEFEKQVLFPLAGLDPKGAAKYYELSDLLGELDFARNTIARRYLDGTVDRAAAEAWLVRNALVSPPKAKKSVDFIERYRAYILNYNHGKRLVKQYVERSGTSADARWGAFKKLLSTPVVPSELAGPAK